MDLQNVTILAKFEELNNDWIRYVSKLWANQKIIDFDRVDYGLFNYTQYLLFFAEYLLIMAYSCLFFNCTYVGTNIWDLGLQSVATRSIK